MKKKSFDKTTAEYRFTNDFRVAADALNACKAINPENPQNVSKVMIEAFIVLKEISNWNFKTIGDARTRARQVFLKATDREEA